MTVTRKPLSLEHRKKISCALAKREYISPSEAEKRAALLEQERRAEKAEQRLERRVAKKARTVEVRLGDGRIVQIPIAVYEGKAFKPEIRRFRVFFVPGVGDPARVAKSECSTYEFSLAKLNTR